MADDDSRGLISGNVVISLLMLGGPGELAKLQRDGWVKPIGPDKWRTVDVVQGAIRQLRTARDEATAGELSVVIDLTPSRIAMMAREGVLPKNRHGRYPLAATVQSYVRYLRDHASDGGEKSLSKQRARLTRSKADIAELQRSRLLGESLPAHAVIAWNTQVIRAATTSFLGVASKLAPRLVAMKNAAQIEALIRQTIAETLEGLAGLTVIPDSLRPPGADRGGRNSGNVAGVRAAAEAESLGVE